MRQAIAKVVGITGGENLRLGFEAPECAGMNDAVAVAGKFGAVWVRWLGEATPARSLRMHGPRRLWLKELNRPLRVANPSQLRPERPQAAGIGVRTSEKACSCYYRLLRRSACPGIPSSPARRSWRPRQDCWREECWPTRAGLQGGVRGRLANRP